MHGKMKTNARKDQFIYSLCSLINLFNKFYKVSALNEILY